MTPALRRSASLFALLEAELAKDRDFPPGFVARQLAPRRAFWTWVLAWRLPPPPGSRSATLQVLSEEVSFPGWQSGLGPHQETIEGSALWHWLMHHVYGIVQQIDHLVVKKAAEKTLPQLRAQLAANEQHEHHRVQRLWWYMDEAARRIAILRLAIARKERRHHLYAERLLDLRNDRCLQAALRAALAVRDTLKGYSAEDTVRLLGDVADGLAAGDVVPKRPATIQRLVDELPHLEELMGAAAPSQRAQVELLDSPAGRLWSLRLELPPEVEALLARADHLDVLPAGTRSLLRSACRNARGGAVAELRQRVVEGEKIQETELARRAQERAEDERRTREMDKRAVAALLAKHSKKQLAHQLRQVQEKLRRAQAWPPEGKRLDFATQRDLQQRGRWLEMAIAR